MSATWQSVGGLTNGHFPLVGPEWIGPDKPESLIDDNDTVKAIRGVFTRPDGRKRLATVKYLARTTKHTLTPVPA